MEHYDLRSCFLPNLSGLHLRIYQFQQLLSQDLPELTKHLEKLKLEPLYLSQWFLSFFGVTCPLPMLLRIYDVILTEGASETLMRVALSLMRRNKKKILATSEFEDVMQLLLSRGMWDTYGCNADDLVNDFCGLTSLVTREALQSLEQSFKDAQNEGNSTHGLSKPSIHSAASRFLGRFWTGSTQPPKSPGLISPSLSAPARPISYLRRTPSKQSMASTLNSVESSDTNLSAGSTEASSVSHQPSADWIPVKQTVTATGKVNTTRVTLPTRNDKDLHSQIEDLLLALGDMQRDHNVLASQLQKEREERDEDRSVVQRVVAAMRKNNALAAIPENKVHETGHARSDSRVMADPLTSLVELEERFSLASSKRSSIVQTKHQLRDEVTHWKEQFHEEVAKSAELSRQLTDREKDATRVKEELRDARSRIQETYRDKQRLEKIVQDLRNRRSAVSDSLPDSPLSAASEFSTSSSGLREFKLGRSTPPPTTLSTPPFAKRSSSLSTQTVLATEDHRPANEDALLLELVTAKTAEAVARQELEEVKGKLDSLRKLLGGTPTSPGTGSGHRSSPSSPALSYMPGVKAQQEPPKLVTPNAPSGGGFFSGWGKRSLSTGGPAAEAR